MNTQTKTPFRSCCKRGFDSAGFRLSMLISFCLALAQILQTYTKVDLGYRYPASLFEIWIGGEWASYANAVTMLVLPILACLPFSASFLTDKQSGYLAQLYLRQPRARVLFGYYGAAFFTGAAATGAPFMMNLLMNALLYPSLLPQASTFTYLPSMDGLFVELFYTFPWLYCLLYIFIMAVFGGFVACVGLSLGHVIKNKFVLLATPFVVYFWIYFICMQLGLYHLNPYIFLNPSQSKNASVSILLLYYFVLGGGSATLFFLRGRKNDLL